MRFEISERIRTRKSQDELFVALQQQFKKVSSRITLDNGQMKVVSIEASSASLRRSSSRASTSRSSRRVRVFRMAAHDDGGFAG